MSTKKKGSSVKDPTAKFYSRTATTPFLRIPKAKGGKKSEIESGSFKFPDDVQKNGHILFSDGTRYDLEKRRDLSGDYSEMMKSLDAEWKRAEKQEKDAQNQKSK